MSAGVLIGVSAFTKAPTPEQLQGLTFATVTREQERQSRLSWNRWDVINSLIVLLLIAAAYLYFNG